MHGASGRWSPDASSFYRTESRAPLVLGAALEHQPSWDDAKILVIDGGLEPGDIPSLVTFVNDRFHFPSLQQLTLSGTILTLMDFKAIQSQVKVEVVFDK